MNTICFQGAAADKAAMQRYQKERAADNSAWRAAFRTAFFQAMRSELTARQYEAMRLYYLEQMPQRAIAAQWGVCPSAVCRHIARAKRRLRHALRFYWPPMRQDSP